MPSVKGRKRTATNFVMNPRTKNRRGRDMRARASAPASRRSRTSAGSGRRRRSSSGTSGASMLLVRRPCSKSSGRVDEEQQDGDRAADRSGEHASRSRTRRGRRAPPKSASQKRRPNSSCGSSPAAIGAATIQNLSGGFSRKTSSSLGLLLGFEPVADLENAVDGEGVDGFVVLEIARPRPTNSGRQKSDEDERQPRAARLSP